MLGEWAGKLTAKLQGMSQFRDVSNEMQLGAAVTKLTIDRVAAARYGFRAEDVDQVLYDAYGQRQIGEYQNEVNQYRIVLEVDSASARTYRQPAVLLSALAAHGPDGAALFVRAHRAALDRSA